LASQIGVGIPDARREDRHMKGSADWLVDTEWLASHLNAPDIVVIDATLYLPTTPRNA
jgi:hypothetical protein